MKYQIPNAHWTQTHTHSLTDVVMMTVVHCDQPDKGSVTQPSYAKCSLDTDTHSHTNWCGCGDDDFQLANFHCRYLGNWLDSANFHCRYIGNWLDSANFHGRYQLYRLFWWTSLSRSWKLARFSQFPSLRLSISLVYRNAAPIWNNYHQMHTTVNI